MPYILGVDSGGTKTFALVGDESGAVHGLGRGGPGNHQAPGGVERAMDCIAEAVESACKAAGIRITDLAKACFCLAGADLPSDYELLTRAISRKWPGLSFTVKNDSFAGLRAGALKSWGVVSINGTGTNCAGIAPDGRELQVGGLGPLYGDFGGAHELGREAIRAAFRAAELRGPATQLTTEVPAGMGCPDIDTLREALYLEQADRSRIALLAPRVFAAASAGDTVAQGLLIQMGTELGDTVAGAIRQLNVSAEEVDVVMAGSTWKGANPLLIDAFRLAVHRAAPRARLLRTRYEPVVGALLLGLEATGIQPTNDLYQKLDETMPAELPINQEQ